MENNFSDSSVDKEVFYSKVRLPAFFRERVRASKVEKKPDSTELGKLVAYGFFVKATKCNLERNIALQVAESEPCSGIFK